MPNYNREAEGATIAAMIQDASFRVEVLSEGDELIVFPQYRKLHEAVSQLVARGETIDQLIVTQEARSIGLTNADSVVRGLPRASTKYLTVLRRLRTERSAQVIMEYLQDNLGREQPGTMLTRVGSMATTALAGAARTSVSLAEASQEGFAMISHGAPKVLRTGIIGLDEALAGVGPGDLVVLGARPSVGKSALASQISRYTAMAGKGSYFSSLEMGEEIVGLRTVAQEARVSFVDMQANKLTQSQWQDVHAAMSRIEKLPFSLAYSGGLTPMQIQAMAMHQQIQFQNKGIRLGLLIVDYLQLVAPIRHETSREREVAALSSAFKRIAGDLGVVVLLLSQLSRSLMNRQNKRPTLSDLRESGAIEQDADTVLFLHRPGYYEGSSQNGPAEIIVAKQRNGPSGIVEAMWDGPTMNLTAAHVATKGA